MKVKVLVTQSLSESFRPHGLEPTRVLHPWNSAGKNTGVGCPALLQGNLPNPGIKPWSPTLSAVSLLSKKVHAWQISKWKDCQHYHSPEKCK